MLINSIYRTTEGEGIHIGIPLIMIRFQGCHIGCTNCDSIDTWEFSDKFQVNFEDVVNKITSLSMDTVKNISITGGDPLDSKHINDVLKLVKKFKKNHYWINIEASGTKVQEEIFDLVDFISFDIKTPSTGVKQNLRALEKMLKKYQGKFQIKSVIETREDFDFVSNIYKSYDISKTPWILTPAYNLKEKFPEQRINSVVRWNEDAGCLFRVIVQQHKIIHGPDKKYV